MLCVRTPTRHTIERDYILKVVLGDFLGLTFEVVVEERENLLLSGRNGRSLQLPDRLFSMSVSEWLSSSSLPIKKLKVWEISSSDLSISPEIQSIPVIYGMVPEQSSFFIRSDDEIILELDIFGSIFYMLTRYEEYVKTERDHFDRFPAAASLSYQSGFLHRPIVNEYVEILWACLKSLWPKLERKPRQFKFQVSHDVDSPYQYAFAGLPSLGRNLLGDFLKRRSLSGGIARVQSWKKARQSNWQLDPFNRFDWLMDLSERNMLTSAFYFMAGCTHAKRDGNYSLGHPLMRDLLRQIHQRGHEIGLHPSFNTYLDASQTHKEFETLKQICLEENIYQEQWGGRQHYLRWQSPTTWQNWESAGLTYDSTLSFAESPGFRAGTCYEFPVFNLSTRETLNLIERPLIVMECSVLDKQYMGLDKDIDAAFNCMAALKKTCRRFNGNFTMLWHNSRLTCPEYRMLYEQLLLC